MLAHDATAGSVPLRTPPRASLQRRDWRNRTRMRGVCLGARRALPLERSQRCLGSNPYFSFVAGGELSRRLPLRGPTPATPWQPATGPLPAGCVRAACPPGFSISDRSRPTRHPLFCRDTHHHAALRAPPKRGRQAYRRLLGPGLTRQQHHLTRPRPRRVARALKQPAFGHTTHVRDPRRQPQRLWQRPPAHPGPRTLRVKRLPPEEIPRAVGAAARSAGAALVRPRGLGTALVIRF